VAQSELFLGIAAIRLAALILAGLILFALPVSFGDSPLTSGRPAATGIDLQGEPIAE
jgi:hypothetical protein